MNKRILISIIIPLVVILIAGMIITKAIAGTAASHTLIIPINPDMGVTTNDNVYLVMWDVDTGYFIDGDTGVPAVDTAWDGNGAAIEGVHAGTNLFAVAFTIPDLDGTKRWAFAGFENAVPANTDTMVINPMMYDPKTKSFYTDTNPLFEGQLRSTNKVIR